MYDPRNYPVAILLLSFAGLWLCAKIGAGAQRTQQNIVEEDRKDLNTVAAATLTLLGLIIAFTFSMAVSRYDQRKNLEAEEANAIGTEYLRASLLPADTANKLQSALLSYLEQRISCYGIHGSRTAELKRVSIETAALEKQMWAQTNSITKDLPGPIAALVIGGLNDVLNSHGYTQAAWSNRIPSAAWVLMALIAGMCSFLIGYGVHRARILTLLVLPLAVSIALFLIADIDSPHGGLIRVRPDNLTQLAESFAGR
jgi:hypothetical protein